MIAAPAAPPQAELALFSAGYGDDRIGEDGASRRSPRVNHLSLADWCILAAALIPLLFTGIAKFGAHGRDYNNHAPRKFQAGLNGWRARAHWAHQNGIEVFPLFGIAVLLAEFRSAPQAWTNILALLFIGWRLLYGALYIADRASLRSAVWTLGFLCCVALFAIAA